MINHIRCTTGIIGIQLLLFIIGAIALSACGSGGSAAGGGGNRNRPPTVNAGVDQSVFELTIVDLNGSGYDPDIGDTLTYKWTQIAGQAVTINNDNMMNANFMGPDVIFNVLEVLTFELLVSDGNVGSYMTDTVDITVQEPHVTVSGNIQYEFVPPNSNCKGLNYNGILIRPIRQATVEIIDDTTGDVIDTTASNDLGEYSFKMPRYTGVSLRVRAELLRNEANPSWNVQVRDNTANTDSSLLERPLYMLDSTVFDTGNGNLNITRNLTATTGWDSTSYTDIRAAAPFSALDIIYSAMLVILAENSQADFPALDVFWSINNSTVEGDGTYYDNIASGEIGYSFYDRNKLFLLGMADDDTDEFDDHIIVHEWGHYFENNFSRSDSMGGEHYFGESLDMRVAFGEGFATALSGIGLNNPIYCDTYGAGQGRGWRMDIENDNVGFEGWFNEISLQNLIYDLWDTNNDGADNDSLGFGAIYNVMTGAEVVTPAFTSIFSFVSQLKAQNPDREAFINTLLVDHNITAAGIDIYGSTETNNRSDANDVLPIYTNAQIGTSFEICSNSQFDNGRIGNKLSEHRYLILDINPASALTFTVDNKNPLSQPSADFDCTADINNSENHEHSDPDIVIYQNGNIISEGTSCKPNREVMTSPILSGRYIIDIVEHRYLDDDSPNSFPEQSCFDITITP